MRIIAILFSLALLSLSNNAVAARKYLYTWDNGSGTNMPGWTYYPRGNQEITSGHPGWINDTAWTPATGQQGTGPRSFALDGYDTQIEGQIVTVDRAPSTSTGGSFEVYDSQQVTNYQATWWVWYDGPGLGMAPRTVANSNTDRMSYYIKVHADDVMDGTNNPGTYFHVGTYLCDNSPSGEGCPKEGPGNAHYYFYMYYQPNIWIHTLLDRHPTHLRGSYIAGDDPAYINPSSDDNNTLYPMHFYEHLQKFYMEIRDQQTNPTNYIVDEIYYYWTGDSTEEAEPNQNDNSVTSLWIGYDPSTGKWYTGWQDESYETASGENTNDDTNSTFEIRWSTSPITNANYSSANIISPEWFSGPEHTSYPNGIRRQDAWSVKTWTRFDLHDGVEAAHNHIYFAIKDVSVAGGNAGTQWPYNKGDGHDAASPYIKTIDYYIRPDDSGTCSDGIQNGDETGIDCGGSCPPCATVISCGTSPMIH